MKSVFAVLLFFTFVEISLADEVNYKIGDIISVDVPVSSFFDCVYTDTEYDISRNNVTANVRKTFALPCKFKSLKETDFKTLDDYKLYSKLEEKELDKAILVGDFKVEKVAATTNEDGLFEDTFTFVKWKSDIDKNIQAIRNDSKNSLKSPMDKKLQKLCEEFDKKTNELVKKMDSFRSYEVLSKIEDEEEAKKIEIQVKKAANRLFFHMSNPKYKKCPESTNQMYFPDNETLRKEFKH